jgi:hypothetical protein
MHARHFQSQQTVHTLPPEELRSLKHSRHTNKFAHMIDQANHTSYYWEKKEGEFDLRRLLQEPNMNYSWKEACLNILRTQLHTTSRCPTTHYKPIPNYILQADAQLYEAILDPYQKSYKTK